MLNKTNYYGNVRTDLLDLIPFENRGKAILEVGAAEGNTLLYGLENEYASEIHGIELFEIKNSNQTNEKLKSFKLGNIENIELDYEEDFFDVILCGDVLEHLVNPGKTIQKLKKYLKKDGVLIASIPNIREWNTMKKIFFQGDFRYEDSGILDRTHLRFFTKKNIIELFEENNFNVIKIKSSSAKSWFEYLYKLRFRKFILRLLSEEFLTVQYIIVARKNDY